MHTFCHSTPIFDCSDALGAAAAFAAKAGLPPSTVDEAALPRVRGLGGPPSSDAACAGAAELARGLPPAQACAALEFVVARCPQAAALLLDWQRMQVSAADALPARLARQKERAKLVKDVVGKARAIAQIVQGPMPDYLQRSVDQPAAAAGLPAGLDYPAACEAAVAAFRLHVCEAEAALARG